MKLVVCIDGTWNDASMQTNVWKLKQDLVCGSDSGVKATYVEGIGTVPGDELLAGMFAADFDRPLGIAYRWLTKNVLNVPKDEPLELYLFGFSRGAYIAHTLTWLLHEVGVPRNFSAATLIAKAYVEKDADEVARLCEGGTIASPQVKMLGLWDAVTSPHDVYSGYHDGECAPNVRRVYHAMATDERRKLFDVMHYKSAPGIVQAWFTGVHQDVGGGYPEGECELSDITLDWMKRNAKRHGLSFTQPVGRRPRSYDFSSLSKVHNEETPLDPIRNRVFAPGERIDRSVRDRVKTDSGYFPAVASVPSFLVDWLQGLVSLPLRLV